MAAYYRLPAADGWPTTKSAADSTISIKKLLGLTGYKELTARRPHGTPRHGKSIAVPMDDRADFNIPGRWPAGQADAGRRLSIIETFPAAGRPAKKPLPSIPGFPDDGSWSP